MKRALCLLVLGLFSAAVVGCRAEAAVGDKDTGTNGSSSHYEKKTTVNSDGTRSTKVETRTNP